MAHSSQRPCPWSSIPGPCAGPTGAGKRFQRHWLPARGDERPPCYKSPASRARQARKASGQWLHEAPDQANSFHSPAAAAPVETGQPQEAGKLGAAKLGAAASLPAAALQNGQCAPLPSQTLIGQLLVHQVCFGTCFCVAGLRPGKAAGSRWRIIDGQVAVAPPVGEQKHVLNAHEVCERNVGAPKAWRQESLCPSQAAGRGQGLEFASWLIADSAPSDLDLVGGGETGCVVLSAAGSSGHLL